MTIGYGCVLVAIILPYFFTILAKTGRGFNNSTPREYLENLKGCRKGAHWAQLNTFEALPGFVAAVIIAHQLEAPQIAIDNLAIGFVIMRILYGIFYIANRAALRSLCWFIAFGCVLSLFVVSI